MVQLPRQGVRKLAYANGWGFDEEAQRAVLDGIAGVLLGSLTKGKLLAVQVAKNRSTLYNGIKAVN